MGGRGCYTTSSGEELSNDKLGVLSPLQRGGGGSGGGEAVLCGRLESGQGLLDAAV